MESNKKNANSSHQGDYGVVCFGYYHKVEVAIKVLQKNDTTIPEDDDFMNEAFMLAQLKHEHIVGFLGLCKGLLEVVPVVVPVGVPVVVLVGVPGVVLG